MDNILKDNIPEVFHDIWEKAQSSFPGPDLDFLQDNFIIQANSILNLPKEAIKAFIKSYNIIKNNKTLCRLLWFNHYLFFGKEISIDKKTEERKVEKEIFLPPSLRESMGTLAGMFPAVLLLSGLTRLMEFYRKRNIPQNIIVDTLSDIDIWMRDYFNKHQTWGLAQFRWLYNHFSGRIFRLGRLQFMHKEFDGNLIAFRNITTGEVIAVSQEGVRYRSDGQVDGTNGIYDKEGGWTSKLVIDEEFIQGNPILPLGFAKADFIKLSTREWKEVLAKGSKILEVHIPAESKLSHEACGESFKMSVDFFTGYFPELPFDGYMCTSWLLDPQLKEILPPSSNIVKFQREFYLYPILADDFQTFERVFGGKHDNIEFLKAETSLQKAIIDYISKGNHMRQGGMFLLKDDLKHWGKAFYQDYSRSII
ncbi:MAG: DUF5596 domain-containing protein [Firmicutes bacterium]|nr:DUF5596 domain-containing protein [Bacillota bacterium]